MMKCSRCESERVAEVGGKCSDMFSAELGDSSHQGYVPDDLGIGGGDYLEFSFCLDCGQLQGKFPLPPAAIEKQISDSQVAEFFDNHFTQGFTIEKHWRQQNDLVKWATEESPKFGAFLKDFFAYNQGKKYPSCERFVQMYGTRNPDIE